MKVEVELRAKIKNRELRRRRIESLGAKFLKSQIFFNSYHGHSLFKCKDIQVRVSDAYCLSERKWEFYVGYKGPEQSEGFNIRGEIDEKFGVVKGSSKVLEKLGINGVSLVSTTQVREILEENGFEFFMMMVGDNDERFVLDNLNIKFMSLPQIGIELMEVEKVVSKEVVDSAKKEVWQFMKKLGITKGELIEKEPVQLIYQYYFGEKQLST